MTPPGLAWLPAFSASTGAALGQAMVSEVQTTVNPLVYTISVKWHQSVSKEAMQLIWNLFQKWAAFNQSRIVGSVKHGTILTLSGEERVLEFEVSVHLRERLGLPKDLHPAG